MYCFGCHVNIIGSILEGPDPEKMKPVVAEAMPALITLLRDQSAAVRDTAAWTIGRVCELLPDSALNPSFLVPLVEGLVHGLDDVPRVAANVAWVRYEQHLLRAAAVRSKAKLLSNHK